MPRSKADIPKGSETVDSQVARAIIDAKLRAENGSHRDAKVILEDALRGLGENFALHERLGLILFEEGDAKAATFHLRRALRLDRSMDEGRLTLLRAAIQSEDRATAAEIAAEVLADEPQDPRVLLLAAKAFRRNRAFDRAGELWLQVAATRSSDPQPLLEAAEAFTRAKNFKAAIECAIKAGELDPQAERPKVLRLETLERMKAGPDALAEAVRDLARVNPSAAFDHLPTLIGADLYEIIAELISSCKQRGISQDPVLLGSLASTLKNVAHQSDADQNFEVAARLWQAMLVIDEADRQARTGLRNALNSLLKLGRSASENQDYEAAAMRFRAIVRFDPTQKRAWRDLASTLEKCERWREAAETWLQSADDLSGEAKEAAALRSAKAARKLDGPADQVALTIRARNLIPDSVEVNEWGYRAVDKLLRSIPSAIEDGDLSAPSRDIALARQWDESYPKLQGTMRGFVRSLKARMHEAYHSGNGPEAARLAEALLSFEPDRVQALKLAARQAFQDRRYQYAADLYSRLVELDPQEERHYAKLGRAFKALKMYEQGIPVVMRLLELHPDHPVGRQLLSELLHGQALQHA